MTLSCLPSLGLICFLGLGHSPAMPANAQTSSAAISSPTATDLRLSLAGRWSGSLGYRDYQSNRLIEIPVTTTIEAIADGMTIIRRSLYDDGPNKPVWITIISLDDAAAGSSTSAAFRAGRAVEPVVETLSVLAAHDPTHWTITYRSVGTDGDVPADIRVTEIRDGDTLTATKDVRPIGADDEAWAFRNQTLLTRVRGTTPS